MKFITDVDLPHWLQHHHILRSNSSIEDIIRQLKLESKLYPIPADAISCYDLSRFFWAHFNEAETLFIQLEHNIFTESEEWLLYQHYLEFSIGAGSGALTSSIELGRNDREGFVNLLGFNLMFRWDCLVANAKGSLAWFSHDGLFAIRPGTEEFSKALVELGFH